SLILCCFVNAPAPTEIYTFPYTTLFRSLRRYEGIAANRLAVVLNGIDGAWYRAERDRIEAAEARRKAGLGGFRRVFGLGVRLERSEEHTSELQSRENLVCRLLLEKKKNK